MDPRSPFERAMEYQHLMREMQVSKSRKASCRFSKRSIREVFSSSRVLQTLSAQDNQEASPRKEASSLHNPIRQYRETETQLAGGKIPRLGRNGKDDASQEEPAITSAPLGIKFQCAESRVHQPGGNPELVHRAKGSSLPEGPTPQSAMGKGDEDASADAQSAAACLGTEEGCGHRTGRGVMSVWQVRCPFRHALVPQGGADSLIACFVGCSLVNLCECPNQLVP